MMNKWPSEIKAVLDANCLLIINPLGSELAEIPIKALLESTVTVYSAIFLSPFYADGS
jgi:hypothetical protein